MIETVYYDGSGRDKGTLEKMSKVGDSDLHDRQEIVDLIYP